MFAQPILLGRKKTIQEMIDKAGLRLTIGKDVKVHDPYDSPAYEDNWRFYHQLTARHGVSIASAREAMYSNPTALAAVMVAQHQADGMLCGKVGRYKRPSRTI